MNDFMKLLGTLSISISCAYALPSQQINSCTLGYNLDKADAFFINNKFSEAIKIYSCYMTQHPNDKAALINYIEAERAIENYNVAINLLHFYSKSFGVDNDYLRTKARVYADAGFYESALWLNNPLIKNSPNDSYLQATQASALFQSGELNAGVTEFQKLIKKDPESDDIAYLGELITKTLQSNVSIGSRFDDLTESTDPLQIPTSGQYIHQNDSVNVSRVPFELQYYINNDTNLIFKIQNEFLTADSGNDLVTNTGRTSINDVEVLVGIENYALPHLKFQALIGNIAISNGANRFAAYVGAMIKPTERWTIKLGALHDLFRPIDLSNGSPRSVSLAIMETGARIHTNYKISLESTVDVDFRVSHLSDSNSYVRLAIEPGWVIYNANKFNFMLGLNTEWLSYNKNLFNNGYYSPSFFQLYEIIGLAQINLSPKLLFITYAGGGVTKDNFSNIGLASDVGVETKYTFYKSLDFVTQLNYIVRDISPCYNEFQASLGLTWRFA